MRLFTYNHTAIELRKDSTDAAVMYSFSNATRMQILFVHSTRLGLGCLDAGVKARYGNAKRRSG
jgi:hypothetical protein